MTQPLTTYAMTERKRCARISRNPSPEFRRPSCHPLITAIRFRPATSSESWGRRSQTQWLCQWVWDIPIRARASGDAEPQGTPRFPCSEANLSRKVGYSLCPSCALELSLTYRSHLFSTSTCLLVILLDQYRAIQGIHPSRIANPRPNNTDLRAEVE